MGGAFSFAQGAAARGCELPGAAAPFFLRSGACAPPGRGAGRAGGLPAAGASSFLCCALNLLFCFTCDKPFAFCLLAFSPSHLREIFV